MAIRFAVKEGKNQHGYYEYQGNADVAQVRRVLKRLGYHDKGYNKNPAGMMNRLTFYFADSVNDAEPEADVDLDFLIKDEFEAIDGYRKMIAKTSNPQLLSVLSHILDEETEHVEELRAAQAGVYEVEDD